MNVLFLTSGSPRDTADSITALRYAADNLEISACVLDCDAVLEDFAHFCAGQSIPVHTRASLRDAVASGAIQTPDVGLAYHSHKIVKRDLLDFPKSGIINFHPAPLPEYKGVSACTYAILHRYEQWGVSAYYMNEGIDTGPIIQVRRFAIGHLDCSSVILQRINYGHLLLLFKEIIDILASGVIPDGTPQIPGAQYYSRKQLALDKIIQPTDDREAIDHKIKAMWFPPFQGANITIDGEQYTLVNQKILDELGVLYSFALEEHKELFEALK